MKHSSLLILLFASALSRASEQSSSSALAQAPTLDPEEYVRVLIQRIDQANEKNKAATKKVEALQHALEEQAACGIAWTTAKTHLEVHLQQLQRCRLPGIEQSIKEREEELAALKLKPSADLDETSRKELVTKQFELENMKTTKIKIANACISGCTALGMPAPIE